MDKSERSDPERTWRLKEKETNEPDNIIPIPVGRGQAKKGADQQLEKRGTIWRGLTKCGGERGTGTGTETEPSRLASRGKEKE